MGIAKQCDHVSQSLAMFALLHEVRDIPGMFVSDRQGEIDVVVDHLRTLLATIGGHSSRCILVTGEVLQAVPTSNRRSRQG
jgi:hypothetical protein